MIASHPLVRSLRNPSNRRRALGATTLKLWLMSGVAVALTAALTAPQAAAEDAPPAAPAPAKAGPSQAQASASVASTEVALARFTTAVEEREPVDSITFLDASDAGADRVLFYTDLRGLEGDTVTHRWEYNGQVMGEVPFQIGGPRWRVWSSKQLMPTWLGEWSVEVVKGDGEVIATESFTYQGP